MELSKEEQELKDILDLNGLSKKTWKPIATKTFVSNTSSKFSGVPYFLKNEKWPVCPGCQTPYQLLLQLNFEEMPDEMKLSEKGFFQLFVCKSEGVKCYLKGYSSSSPTYLIKIIKYIENNIQIEEIGWPNEDKFYIQEDIEVPYKLKVVENFENEQKEFSNYSDNFLYYLPEQFTEEKFEKWFNDLFPEKTIKGWEEHNDYTENFDLINNKMGDIEREKFYDLIEKIKVRGEKLGGHAVWIQRGDNYGTCPICKKAWTEIGFFFQISSQEEENIPFIPELFGDGGTLYIYNCEKHKNAFFIMGECC